MDMVYVPGAALPRSFFREYLKGTGQVLPAFVHEAEYMLTLAGSDGYPVYMGSGPYELPVEVPEDLCPPIAVCGLEDGRSLRAIQLPGNVDT